MGSSPSTISIERIRGKHMSRFNIGGHDSDEARRDNVVRKMLNSGFTDYEIKLATGVGVRRLQLIKRGDR